MLTAEYDPGSVEDIEEGPVIDHPSLVVAVVFVGVGVGRGQETASKKEQELAMAWFFSLLFYEHEQCFRKDRSMTKYQKNDWRWEWGRQ